MNQKKYKQNKQNKPNKYLPFFFYLPLSCSLLSQDTIPTGTIYLKDVLGVSKSYKHSGRFLCFSVTTDQRVYYLQAESSLDLDSWLDAIICAVIARDGLIQYSEQLVAKMRLAFDKFDKNQDGVLNVEELSEARNRLVFIKYIGHYLLCSLMFLIIL